MADSKIMIYGQWIKLIDNGDGTFSLGEKTQGITMSKAKTAVLANSLVIKATAGTLYWLLVHNTSANTQYFQIHDSAALPADGAVPSVTVPVMAGGVGEFPFGDYGYPCTAGIVVCNSSTLATKTIGSSDSWFVATYK